MAQQIIIKGTPVVGANEVLVADSNSKIPAVDGSAVTAMAGGNIAGTIPTARLDTGTTANKLVVLGGSGLPAVDGSLLTGIVSHTTSASNPTVSTNPSGGVGTEWINSTTGKQFICTDATAGENVWTCSGGGSGNVSPFHFTGCTTSYFVGGGSGTPLNMASIDKGAFASDGNATDQGDITLARRGLGSSSSTTHGYQAGGYASTYDNTIDKFAMATTSNSTDVGNLSTAWLTFASITSDTHGYAAGGSRGAAGIRHVTKYSHTTDGGSTDIGDLISVNHDYPLGGISSTHGYAMGAHSGAPTNRIDKFSYASETGTASVGDTVHTTGGNASQSTTGYIYTVGTGAGYSTRIDKMATATDSDMVVSGSTLSVAISDWCGGSSSATYGYTLGGYRGSSGPAIDTIDKFSFSSTGTATDVGNLTIGRGACNSTNQY
jgi:hypothetical protein